ncbi:Mss4-like protein [Mycena rebaudengoi]|nr:Mss4-like protein [Mycena rebaudengoi]
MSDAGLKTYEGNCHCGAVKFTVSLPPLETTPLHACQCSICTKKGYLFVFATKSALRFAKGAGSDGLGGGVLRDYEFNDRQMTHRFCGTCGTPFGIVRAGLGPADKFAFNARMLRDVDLWALEVKTGAGMNTKTVYAVPVFPGLAELEQSKAEGEKVYSGSCHCGAVTFALKSAAPLEVQAATGVEEDAVKECDCSICIRIAGLYTYPRPLTRVSMHIVPPDTLVSYFYPLGRKFGATQFCGLCGCAVGQHIEGPPAERVATLPPNVQAIIAEKRMIKPVHLRALTLALGRSAEEKAEWERIVGAVRRERGSKEGTPYIVPE